MKLQEAIYIDVKIGDTIMTGKFKNKKTVVKSITTDEHGMPVINGRKATTFRLKDTLKEDFGVPKNKWVEKKLSELDQDVLDELWDMYEHTYKSIGLIVKNLNELTSKYKISLLIDVDKDPLPDAFVVFKPTRFGNKAVLSGTDGSREGKSALVKHKIATLKNKSSRWYVEASHRIADILNDNNVPVVQNKDDVETVLGKKVKWLDDNGKYERVVGGSIKVTKQLFGNPKL